jgi:serpin B
MMRNFLYLLAFFLAFGLIGEASSQKPQNIKAVIEANNRFAFDFYRLYVQKYKEDNIFFSPLSIASALSMLYEGARGGTAEEIRKAFHLPAQVDVLRDGYLSLYEEMNKPKEYELTLANALWVQMGYPFLRGYLSVVERYYGGKATNLDFRRDPEGSRKIINKWVEEKTKGKIKNPVPEGSINPETTRLVITNSLYFKGLWLNPFDTELTKEAYFKISPQKKVKVMMMCTHGPQIFQYAETKDLQILEMEYKGKEISMLVLLPKGYSLKKLEGMLNWENLKKWRGMLHSAELMVYFPKFKMEKRYQMVDDLKKLGIVSVFEPAKADLSGLDGKRDLFVTRVIHSTKIEVNEAGTEAAAATIVFAEGEFEVKTFRADHPFVFIIQNKKTGNILFIGKVYNPEK